jgi:hypothetical protein
VHNPDFSSAMPSAQAINERFEFARFHKKWDLITWHQQGILTDGAIDQAVDYLELAEESDEQPFNRFFDLSGYSIIQISLDHVVRLARRRRRYKGAPVRSALYAVRLISLTIARMYQELMEGSRIEVCIFRDRQVAADWLEVPVAILLPPKRGVA